MTEGEFLEFLNAVDWKMICFNTLCILTIFIAAIAYPISKDESSLTCSEVLCGSILMIFLFQVSLSILVLCLWLKDLIITIVWWKSIIFFIYILIIWIGIVRNFKLGNPICEGAIWHKDEWKKISAIIWPMEIVFSLLIMFLFV